MTGREGGERRASGQRKRTGSSQYHNDPTYNGYPRLPNMNVNFGPKVVTTEPLSQPMTNHILHSKRSACFCDEKGWARKKANPRVEH